MPIAANAPAIHTHFFAVQSELSAILISSLATQLEFSTAISILKTLSSKSTGLKPAKRQRVKVSKLVEVSKQIIKNTQQLLIKYAQLKINAAINFPLDLSDHTNYIAVQNFQFYIDTARARQQNVCTFYRLFVAVGSKHVLKKTEKLV